MTNTLNTIIYIYIILTFISFLVLSSSIKKANGVQRSILILLSIAALWAVSDNIFWLFNENSFSITTKIPLFSEYTDYIITTPLSLCVLAWFAMNKIVKDKSIFPIIILSDITMLFLGGLAEYSSSYMRYVWYWLAFIPFIVIMYFIWHTLRLKAKSQTKIIYKSYLTVSIYITFFWNFYAIFWLLSPFGFNLITHTNLLIAYHSTNIFTKAGYYLLFYNQLRLANMEIGIKHRDLS